MAIARKTNFFVGPNTNRDHAIVIGRKKQVRVLKRLENNNNAGNKMVLFGIKNVYSADTNGDNDRVIEFKKLVPGVSVNRVIDGRGKFKLW